MPTDNPAATATTARPATTEASADPALTPTPGTRCSKCQTNAPATSTLDPVVHLVQRATTATPADRAAPASTADLENLDSLAHPDNQERLADLDHQDPQEPPETSAQPQPRNQDHPDSQDSPDDQALQASPATPARTATTDLPETAADLAHQAIPATKDAQETLAHKAPRDQRVVASIAHHQGWHLAIKQPRRGRAKNCLSYVIIGSFNAAFLSLVSVSLRKTPQPS